MKLKIFKKISVLVLILFWVFLGWPVFQVQSVSASTSYYDPISDVSTGWDCTGTDCAQGHYSVLNDGVRVGNTPNTGDGYISAVVNPSGDILEQHKIASITESNINYLRLYYYAETGNRAGININLNSDGVSQGSFSLGQNSIADWRYIQWDNPTPGEISGEFALVDAGSGQKESGIVYAWYIEVDYTAPVISISLDPTEFDYGIMDLSEEKRATSVDPPGATGITVTNTGDVNVDLEIKGDDAVGGTQPWILSDVIGTDQYVHEFSTDLTDFTNPASLTSTYQSLANNIAPSVNQAFDLNIKIPSSVTEKGVEMSAPVTIRATEAGI